MKRKNILKMNFIEKTFLIYIFLREKNRYNYKFFNLFTLNKKRFKIISPNKKIFISLKEISF